MSAPCSARRSGPCTISFSGIDGAGKSTQIDTLQKHAQAQGMRVAIVTFWDDVVQLKQLRESAGHKVFQGDAGVGTPEAPIERRDKNVRNWWMTLVRLGLYCLDTAALCWKHARLRRHRQADLIIFDRYIFDELANLDTRVWPLRLYVKALLRVAPRPEFCLVLDADPVAARARKPEYPLDFLIENRAAYLRLSALARLTIIPPLPIARASSMVLGLVFPHVGNAPRSESTLPITDI